MNYKSEQFLAQLDWSRSSCYHRLTYKRIWQVHQDNVLHEAIYKKGHGLGGVRDWYGGWIHLIYATSVVET